MKLAVVGSRTFTDYAYLKESISLLELAIEKPIRCIVSGGASGADRLAEVYAAHLGLEIIVYKPDWAKYGKRAGLVRNTKIIEDSDLVLVFWDGKSAGTKDSIQKAKKMNKKLVVKLF